MTDRQKQHLLGYLGYYTAEVDGIWGPMSEKAAKDFQADAQLEEDKNFGEASQKKILAIISGEEQLEEPENFWQEIRYFRREEFRCTCRGRGCDGFPTEPAERLVRNAEAARIHFGKAAIVSSGVRCRLRNAELPGSAANSLHLRGYAMDFAVIGVSATKLLAFVQTLPGVAEAYAIDGSYVHMGVTG